MDKLFYCYSGKLKSFLIYKKDFKYLHKGHNFKTSKDFWVFNRTEELNEALTEWAQNKYPLFLI